MITILSKNKLDKNTQEIVLKYIKANYDSSESSNDVNFKIDETIIGGIKIVIDSEVIDLTVNSRLQKIIEIIKK